MGLMPDTIDRSITNGRYGITVYTFSSRLLTLLLLISLVIVIVIVIVILVAICNRNCIVIVMVILMILHLPQTWILAFYALSLRQGPWNHQVAFCRKAHGVLARYQPCLRRHQADAWGRPRREAFRGGFKPPL